MEKELDGLPIHNNDEEILDKDLAGGENIKTAYMGVSFTQALLKTAAEYIGVSRQNNLPQVAKFLALFDLETKINGKWVPFCAAGLSYAACKAYCDLSDIKYTSDNSVEVFKSIKHKVADLEFLPSPSCGTIMQHAQENSTWLSEQRNEQVYPGYLVLYNWNGGTWPDHIGLVESATYDKLHTIEFNTSDTDNINGGVVARRIRDFKHVLGFVKI